MNNEYDISANTSFADDIRAVVSKYCTADSAYALISLVLGFLFIRWTMLTSPVGLGMSLFTYACCGLALLRIRLSGRKISVWGIMWAISACVFGSVPSFVLSRDVCTLALLLAAMCFLMLCVRGSCVCDSGYLPLDAVCALFRPFIYFFGIFPAMCVPFVSGGKKSRNIATVLGGVLLAAVPTCVVVFLLMRADAAFEGVMDRVLDSILPDDGDEIALNIVNLIIGLPCGMYIFGALTDTAHSSCQTAESREKCRTGVENLRVASPWLTCAAFAPLCIVYLVFFLSQTGYLPGMSSALPEGFNIAEYARRGFFDLCTVSGINLALIAIAMLFAKRGKALNIAVTVLSSFTIALAITALIKLGMYIARYGLTVNRIYPAAFMVVLIVCFGLLIVSLYRPLRLIPICCAVCVAVSGVLLCAEPDRIVGMYNAHMYAKGNLESLDLYHYRTLSPSAAEYLLPFADDERIGEAVLHVIGEKYNELERRGGGLSEWSFYNFRAERLHAMFEPYCE